MIANTGPGAVIEPISGPVVGAGVELRDAAQVSSGLGDLRAEVASVRDDLERRAKLVTEAAGRGD